MGFGGGGGGAQHRRQSATYGSDAAFAAPLMLGDALG